MLDFTLPRFPEVVPVLGASLTVRSTSDLMQDEVEALRAQISGEISRHASFRQEVQFAGGKAEFRGVIGIHRVQATAEGDLFQTEPQEKHWIHFQLDLLTGVRPRPHKGDSWDELAHAVSRVLNARPIRVSAFWSLPRDRVTFAVTLPIELGYDIPGFSEIRGVRLAQPDPDNPDDDLYSLILNHSGKSATVQISASFESTFSHDLLTKALDRATAVANFGVEYEPDDHVERNRSASE